MKRLFACVALCTALFQPAWADRGFLGFGLVISNDVVDGNQDRWQSASHTLSILHGPGWTGAAPKTFGKLLEYRLRADVISPEFIAAPTPGDRPFVAPVSFGVHTHWTQQDWDMQAGIDLVAIGPQTGVLRAQRALHDVIKAPTPATDGFELDDAIYPTAQVGVSRVFQLADAIHAQPFVQAQAGVETFARAGVDVVIGAGGRADLNLRDATTGQLYRAINGRAGSATSLTVGADITHVAETELLGEDQTALTTRRRVRAGVRHDWQMGAAAFLGAAYLSPEFEGQDEGQYIGTLSVSFPF